MESFDDTSNPNLVQTKWEIFMLLSYHLPITDLRPFMPKKSSKLICPVWPYPLASNKASFVRGFGKVYRRNSEGFDHFSGGSEVCDVRGVIRFKTPDPEIVMPGNKAFKVDCQYRRFLVFDGPNAKIELGLTEKENQPLSAQVAVEDILEGMIDLPMNIVLPQAPHSKKAPKKSLNQRKPREYIDSKLGEIGCNISKALLYASTFAWKGVKHENWWIQVGNPLVFMEFNQEEPFQIPTWLKPLDCSNNDVDVYKYILKDGFTISYIIKRKNHNKARSKSRMLRVILSGLHCHSSNIENILPNLGEDKLHIISTTTRAIRVQEYFANEKKHLCEFISKASHYKIDGTSTEMPMPFEAARINTLIQNIEKWKPSPPSFVRKLAHDFIKLCETDIREIILGKLFK